MIQNDVGKWLINNYYHVVCKHENKPENIRVAVLVETRDAFFLPLILKNFISLLGETWNFHLFVTEKVKIFLSIELPEFQYQWTPLSSCTRMTTCQYSFLLRQSMFWEKIKEENILIFQTDCLLLRPIPTWAEQYDMIGAPCGVICGDRCTFNGGFSLRKKTSMIKVALITEQQNQQETRPEDVFFTEELWKQKEDFHLPSIVTAFQFATENVYSTHPIGIHGTDKYYGC